MPARSGRVVEDDSDSMPPTRADTAHTVTQIDAIAALRTLNGPVMNGEGHGIALSERHDLGAALHARPLFGQNEFTTCEVLSGLRKQDGNLNREREIAVKILVQAVEVARHILQQKRGWPCLTRLVTRFEKRLVIVGIALLNSHPFVPQVGDGREGRIERRSKAAEKFRKWIFEVTILAFAEAVPRHMDVATEMTFIRVESRDTPALLR